MRAPNIPDTNGQPTPELVRAVKDNLEILTGRRGNAIKVPELRILTFSATPTQAECEALMAYVNAWAIAVRDAIDGRLNSSNV